LLAMTCTASKIFIDDVTHRVDQVMCKTSEEELGANISIPLHLPSPSHQIDMSHPYVNICSTL
jgi:hypothetical protein